MLSYLTFTETIYGKCSIGTFKIIFKKNSIRFLDLFFRYVFVIELIGQLNASDP